jgi:L-serine dehydratase
MEMKSSMGIIVAAPTAGSCGAMPGAVLAIADALGADEDERARALLVAGLIGVFIARDASFAAEEGGCMAECGSGRRKHKAPARRRLQRSSKLLWYGL